MDCFKIQYFWVLAFRNNTFIPPRVLSLPTMKHCFVFVFALLTVLLHAQPAPSSETWGRVKTHGAYLEYGLGTDRLGGARIGMLDSGVLLRLVDSNLARYRVKLSGNFHAWIDRDFIRHEAPPSRAFFLAKSWIVAGNEAYDSLSVSLDERLPYRSYQLVNPSRIVIDIYGATSNTNWINKRSSATAISNVYYEQVEDGIYRVTIELRHRQHWGHSIAYSGNTLVIKVKRQPRKLDLDQLTVAVDAGHGGSNGGAAGVTSRISEKDYTLLIARELEKELRNKGANIFMTRTRDVTLGMSERIEMLNKANPHFLVSIHLNSSARDSIRGVSTYYRHEGFRPLSQFILARLLETGLAEFGNIGSFNFALSGPTEYPNCLVEVAFLSNREDEQRILDPKFHRLVAEKIVAGIKDWLEWCEDDQSSGGKGSPR